jgi:superfamily I DNA/RNA helicase
MNFNEYQEAIFEEVKNGKHSNIVIEAIAGSGKTSTLVEIVKRIPLDKRVLMVAFNKSVVDELSSRIKQSNVTICTSHSLGYRMLRQYFQNQQYTPSLEVDQYKYRNYIKKNFRNLVDGIEFKDKREMKDFKDTILSLIDLCRVYLCKNAVDIETIAEKYNYEIKSEHIKIIKHIIDWGQDIKNLDTIDYTDMICLPNVYDITLDNIKYDWVHLDECQDLSVTQQKLVRRCIADSGRSCYVGDSKQAIQSFAGSCIESFEKLKAFPDTILMPLSINYRCPLFVEGIAKQYVPNFQVFHKERVGIIGNNVLVKDIKDNAMVICRKTQPLINLYLRLIKDNRPCYIMGIDIGSNIIETIEDLNKQRVSCDLESDGIVPSLYKSFFEHRDELIQKYNIDIKDATTERSVQNKLELINTIIALSDNIDNVDELIDRCKRIFYQKNSKGICLITNHKAKGLENDVVYHLCPSLLPDCRAKKDWEIQTETNLAYVLYTRTKNEFYTISEDDFPAPKGSKNIDELIAHLNNVEYKIKKINGKKDLSTNISDKIIKLITPKKKRGTKKKGNVEPPKFDVIDKDNKILKLERIMIGKTVQECYDIFNDFSITSEIRVVKKNEKINDKTISDRINVSLKAGKVNEIIFIG